MVGCLSAPDMSEGKVAPAATETAEVASRLVHAKLNFQPTTLGLSSVALPLGTVHRENALQQKTLVRDRVVLCAWRMVPAKSNLLPILHIVLLSGLTFILMYRLIQQFHRSFFSAPSQTFCVAFHTQGGNGSPSAAGVTAVADDASALENVTQGLHDVASGNDQGLYLTSTGPNHDLLKQMDGENTVSVLVNGRYDLWTIGTGVRPHSFLHHDMLSTAKLFIWTIDDFFCHSTSTFVFRHATLPLFPSGGCIRGCHVLEDGVRARGGFQDSQGDDDLLR